MMLDFHTHKNHIEKGILSIRSIHTQEKEAVEKSEYYSVGIHPWYINEERMGSDLEWMGSQLGKDRVCTIGECGLDALQGPDMRVQQTVFEQQLDMAAQYNKPVTIHCVRAYSELIASIRRVNPKVPLIVHGFNKRASIYRMLADEGLLFSFGHHILSDTSSAYRILQQYIQGPFFLETDDTDIHIGEIYQCASRILDTPINGLIERINKYASGIGIPTVSVIKKSQG